VGLFAAGADQPVPYMINNSSNALAFYPGTNTGSSAARDMLLTLRFRGISANRFSIVQMGRSQLFYTTAVAGAAPPVSASGWQRATYSVTGNNANWAPTSIRLAVPGGNRQVRMTWHRINKISAT